MAALWTNTVQYAGQFISSFWLFCTWFCQASAITIGSTRLSLAKYLVYWTYSVSGRLAKHADIEHHMTAQLPSSKCNLPCRRLIPKSQRRCYCLAKADSNDIYRVGPFYVTALYRERVCFHKCATKDNALHSLDVICTTNRFIGKIPKIILIERALKFGTILLFLPFSHHEWQVGTCPTAHSSLYVRERRACRGKPGHSVHKIQDKQHCDNILSWIMYYCRTCIVI